MPDRSVGNIRRPQRRTAPQVAARKHRSRSTSAKARPPARTMMNGTSPASTKKATRSGPRTSTRPRRKLYQRRLRDYAIEFAELNRRRVVLLANIAAVIAGQRTAQGRARQRQEAGSLPRRRDSQADDRPGRRHRRNARSSSSTWRRSSNNWPTPATARTRRSPRTAGWPTIWPAASATFVGRTRRWARLAVTSIMRAASSQSNWRCLYRADCVQCRRHRFVRLIAVADSADSKL